MVRQAPAQVERACDDRPERSGEAAWKGGPSLQSGETARRARKDVRIRTRRQFLAGDAAVSGATGKGDGGAGRSWGASVEHVAS